MRIILITLLLSWGSPVWADPGETFALTGADAAGLYEPLTRRQAGPSERVQALPGFQAQIYAYGLGTIQDMAVAADGTIYTTDARAGRVYEITDRARDGRRDLQRAILTDMDHPSGLAVTAETMFVADRHAVWAINRKTRVRTQLASLQNSPAELHRPLLWHAPSDSVWIALNRAAHSTEIIAVNRQTGRARRVGDIPGAATDMELAASGAVWLSAGRDIYTVTEGTGTQKVGQAEANIKIAGIALIGGTDLPEGFAAWRDHIFLSQSGGARQSKTHSGGMNIGAISTEFGRLTDTVSIWADGFVERTGRSAWGEPGALLADERGLFIADPWNGTIWRVSPDPVRASTPIPVIEEAPDIEVPIAQTEPTSSAPPLIQGSRIDQASSLEVGSTILKAWEEEKAKKAEEEKADDPEKTRP